MCTVSMGELSSAEAKLLHEQAVEAEREAEAAYRAAVGSPGEEAARQAWNRSRMTMTGAMMRLRSAALREQAEALKRMEGLG